MDLKLFIDEEHNGSVIEFARVSGLAEATIYNLLKGSRYPNKTTREKLLSATKGLVKSRDILNVMAAKQEEKLK